MASDGLDWVLLFWLHCLMFVKWNCPMVKVSDSSPCWVVCGSGSFCSAWSGGERVTLDSAAVSQESHFLALLGSYALLVLSFSVPSLLWGSALNSRGVEWQLSHWGSWKFLFCPTILDFWRDQNLLIICLGVGDICPHIKVAGKLDACSWHL